MTPNLLSAYAEPNRRYHTLAHIQACLAELDAVPGLSARDDRLLRHALWWHDAIYDARRSDNEARSAEMARRDLTALGFSAGEVEEIARLILLTRGHSVEPGDRLGALMVSIDLSILGAAPADYDRYAAGVRHEYAHVPEDAFRAGRGRVMRHFLETPILFAAPEFSARLDAPARANLARELATLS
ncbi:putative metal-dependent HD superfamily phosphohydrolase [Caulobacter ginsengisoli]|uniref:Metal-dependent HD superfamily phosphohydrolase n=1 Tax=Caulobacter ginsengisoli TaxID=400775 RepID=A0ABU0IPL1_9CAUL|nr:phosphohydrolase [Caulobacter ginsengisoli]MDQ0463945.1 putative metal-dependent HD superfamily phosphohydrolase [Caulobacter ginsengisoli]